MILTFRHRYVASFIFSLFLSISISNITFAQACNRTQDSLALVALYDATGGANWTIPWILETPMDQWYGVILNDEGCVLTLDLDGNTEWPRLADGGNNLMGTLPSELFNLSNLEGLYLSQNNLSGPIPMEVGNLKSLRYLYIFESSLEGDIPSSITNLVNVEDLVLYNNKLSGNLPASIGDMRKLFSIWLSENDIEGSIPSSIGNLSNLEFLDLSKNEIEGDIPTSIGQLRNLSTLSLSENRLTGNIPTSLSLLTKLRTFGLSNNMLSGSLPADIGTNAPQFTRYDVSFNNLSGPIPKNIGNIRSSILSLLDLSHNNFTGPIPAELGLLEALVGGTLYLNDNNLSCFFPAELLRFCGNEFVSFSNNPLLPWEGDFTRFCARERQIGANCDDGNASTTGDVIDDNCNCASHREELNLIADESITVCGLDEAIVFSSVVGDSYRWSDGSTERNLTVSESGEYWLETSIDGQAFRDTIEVIIVNEVLDLGPDETICLGDGPAILSSSIAAEFYYWSDGSVTDQIVVDSTDMYWLEATIDQCVFRDTIDITVNGGGLGLAEEIYLCDQSSVTIGPIDDADSYIWNNGATTREIEVSDQGEYWLETDNEGCISRDTVTVFEQLDLEIDVNVRDCKNKLYTLSSGAIGETYRWNTGATTETIEVELSNTYWLEVKNGTCTQRDSLELFFDRFFEADFPENATPCVDEEYILGSQTTNSDLVWEDGFPDEERLIADDGNYKYSIISGGCTYSDSVNVAFIGCSVEDCPIYVPNSVSRQASLLDNTSFKVFPKCELDEFKMEVFDRWGSLLYRTFDLDSAWNMEKDNQQLNTGTYIVHITYLLSGDTVSRLLKKTFTIL